MRFYLLIMLFIASFKLFASDALDVKKWQSDIQYYTAQLKQNHIDLFHSQSETQFEQKLADLTANLPNMTRNQVLVELMKITQSIGDGHTAFPLWAAKLNSFPFELTHINNRFYVTHTTHDYRKLLGAELVSIDGQPILEIAQAVNQVAQFVENPYSLNVRTARYLPKAEILNGLGIIADSAQAEFTFRNNKVQHVETLKSSRKYQYTEFISYRNEARFRIEKRATEDLWFAGSADKQAVYFKFRHYASVSQMDSLAEKLLDYINNNQSKKLIIDLRDNYGGDFFAGLKLAQHLVLADSLDWRSGVFVLIDNVTFSAAMSNAAQFAQILNATLVGEPTGAKPSGYQDMGQFTLPNSKLKVTYSKRLYHFQTSGKDAVYPDHTIPMSIENYINQTDPQLRWVLKQADWQ
ncbi:peptidase S41 [Catenovulum sp. SM1970]|uniref:S41 family peptidase n=1 Tax=Marinifaba aquimaris TaxID=2741323 RepID=UPI001574161D|nr:S41 family peptidase [Marinifaba aquimaris]NTS76295.1 peptidase S41 [Marinifaba aquimaris]